VIILRINRSLIFVACVVVVAVLVGAFVWPFTDLIAAHDVGHIVGSQRAGHLQTAREAVRSQMLTLGAGLFALAALIYTARNYALSRESQVTDRYTKAIEQLGSKEADIRIGGIYALERIAYDSARDHSTVIEVLSTFVREHSQAQWSSASDAALLSDRSLERHVSSDVQAAMRVIGRRNVKQDRDRIALYGTDFSGLILRGAWLAGADLTSSNLIYGFLSGTTFAYAWLPNTNLIRARLDGCDLGGAWISRANLTEASLIGAVLSGAKLDKAILVRANLADARVDGVNVAGADLTDAQWPLDAPTPQGWERQPGSPLLRREHPLTSDAT
jgi:uncharacterized protein YjbI with pentapeptide repeats